MILRWRFCIRVKVRVKVLVWMVRVRSYLRHYFHESSHKDSSNKDVRERLLSLCFVFVCIICFILNTDQICEHASLLCFVVFSFIRRIYLHTMKGKF